ncbi:hypothetical protein KP77_07970 [Jeotgalibacillus alimentarius]|uniref:Cbb3-type cytochrome c oxidase subunit I n=1 Tax=Jeotgalibacillus alimentarius TaxID=135826 RepID=A0A0C2RLY6_9BACL|nr:hypothetical protein [Jeotgalibacillus alimentarius]KIL51285.1 hypothetical protein KP77_07970 [Jeotgalibacillus alimentarius]
MHKKHSNLLLKTAAIFGMIGAGIGGHMAGSYDYAFRAAHAHILVVGWLSLFSWAVYYRVFKPVSTKLATAHVYTAIIGTVGLTSGMIMDIFSVPQPFYFIVYIGGGVTLLVSFILFALLAFMKHED